MDELLEPNVTLAGIPVVTEESFDMISDVLLVVMLGNPGSGPATREDTAVNVVAGVNVLRLVVGPRSRDAEAPPQLL